jgi:PHP family Zn ribbon phosphoesterase
MAVNLPKSGLPVQAYSVHDCLNNSCDIELNDSDDSDSAERIQEHKN